MILPTLSAADGFIPCTNFQNCSIFHVNSHVLNRLTTDPVADELCALLGPVREGDPELISFDERGLAKPTPGIGRWPELRAATSIDRYKINGHEPMREARQKIWERCRIKIDQAREALQTEPPSATRQEKQRKAFQEIKEMLNPEEPFTSVVRECLSDSGFYWAQRIASETVRSH